MIALAAFSSIIQAQNSCSPPIEITQNQAVESEEALEQYYRDRERGLLYGHEESLKKAVQYFREKFNKEKEFQSLNALADYYIFTKQVRDSRIALLKSRTLAEEENNPEWQAIVLMLWANLELSVETSDRLSNPIDIYQQALTRSKQVNNVLLEAQIENNILQAKFITNANNNLKTSKPDFESVWNTIQRLQDSKTDTAKQAVKFGFLAINHRDSEIQFLGEKALKFAKDVLKDKPEDESYAYAHGYLGVLYLKQHKLNKAKTLLNEAIFFTRQQNKSITLLYYWYWQLAKLHIEQGDTEQAKHFYNIAIKYLKPVRRAMFNIFPSYQLKMLPKDDDLFKEYADLLLKQAEKQTDREEQQKLLLAALNAIEQLKSTKLQNYFEDECVADLSNEINAKTLPTILSTDSIAFYPIIFEDRIVLLLAGISKQDGKSIYLSQTIVSKQQIQDELGKLAKRPGFDIRSVDMLLEKFGKMLKEKPNSTHGQIWFFSKYLPVSKALYQLLIEPIFNKISGISILVIVPNEKLSTIPFAALYGRGEGELIRTHAIVSAINLGLIEPSKLLINNKFLFGGLSEKQGNYMPLGYVKLLHNALKNKQFYGMGKRSFLNQNFIQDNLRNTLSAQKYGIIHIATHAEFGSTLSSRFLVAYQDNILMDKFEAMMRNKIDKKPINLLVLSACNTATSDENAMLGLAGVAIKARASSVLGSLWEVQAKETAELMENFYDNLLDNKTINSKAVAWQQTQVKYLNNNTGLQKNPYYWAGFILIGSW